MWHEGGEAFIQEWRFGPSQIRALQLYSTKSLAKKRRDGRTDVAVNVADDVADQEEGRVCSLGRPTEGEHAVVGLFLVRAVIRVHAHPLPPVQLEHEPFFDSRKLPVRIITQHTGAEGLAWGRTQLRGARSQGFNCSLNLEYLGTIGNNLK